MKHLKHNIIDILIYNIFLSKIPYSLGNMLRAWYARKKFKKFGEKSTISTNVILLSPNKITIGSNVGIARDVVLDGRGGIEIGDFSLIGFDSVLLTSTHVYSSREIPIAKQGGFRFSTN